jgi:hypothetical protein
MVWVSFGSVISRHSLCENRLCESRFMLCMVGRKVVKIEQYTLLGLDRLSGEIVYVRSDCKWW